MTDLLVKLYQLQPAPETPGVILRRAFAPEREIVMNWVRETFSPGWAQEVAVAFGGQPIRCILAVRGDELLGFACFNTTFQGFFGPVGVREANRGDGIGTALTIRALEAMQEEGFAYAVIGATKAESYYEKALGAIPIPDSWPGAYAGMLPTRQKDQ